MTTRAGMSSIMNQWDQNCLSCLPLNSKICQIWLCLLSKICKYWPISTKLGHNTYAHEGSDEFDYGSDWTRTSRVICPWIWKNCWIWLCLHFSIYKYWPINTKLGENICDHKISDEFDYGCNRTRTVWVTCPWIRKFAVFDFVYTLASANIDQTVPNLPTIYMPIKSQTSSIMGQMLLEHPELFAVEFGKIADSDFVYTLASTNIDQSLPNLVKMYVTIWSWMSLIMDLIGPELSWVICPWIRKFAIFDCLHSSICIYRPISTKLGHNIYTHKVSHEFDYRTNRIRTSRVICPWIWKNCRIWLCYTPASTNINQSAPNLVKMYMTIRSLMISIMDLIRPELSELSTLEWENFFIFDFVYTLASTNINH